MSAAMERAVARLASEGAVLAPTRDGRVFGVFARGDRRRRPLVKVHMRDVQALRAEGVITALDSAAQTYALSAAGRRRVRRDRDASPHAYLAQHAALADVETIDPDGCVRVVRAVDDEAPLKRLTHLRGSRGAPWFSAAELAAAARVRADWEAAQIGALRGSDWSAPRADLPHAGRRGRLKLG